MQMQMASADMTEEPRSANTSGTGHMQNRPRNRQSLHEKPASMSSIDEMGAQRETQENHMGKNESDKEDINIPNKEAAGYYTSDYATDNEKPNAQIKNKLKDKMNDDDIVKQRNMALDYNA